MTISVTPIPKLVEFAAPSFTLGTSNVAGSAVTAVASDSTLLAFDTTDPASVGASSAVGSATVTARRDHVHAGIGGAGTVVDDAIVRFDGTSGASVQGYSSLSPTISDAGVITLASGNIVFPATAAASAGANALSDYEQGTFSPLLYDTDRSDKSQAGDQRLGSYTKIGNRVMLSLHLRMSSLGSLTTGSNAIIGGLPFTSINTGSLYHTMAPSNTDNFDNVDAGFSVEASVYENNDYVTLRLNDVANGSSGMTVAEFSSNGNITLTGSYNV
tara:strand:- start:412 stop:1227 length:816 start_codon:yes stop_codon:yes gene_type:complete